MGGYQVLKAMLRQDSATGETKLDVTNPEMLAEFEAAWLQMKESLRPADAPTAGRPRKYVISVEHCKRRRTRVACRPRPFTFRRRSTLGLSPLPLVSISLFQPQSVLLGH
jgi:hypothetical protein